MKRLMLFMICYATSDLERDLMFIDIKLNETQNAKE